MCVVAMLAQKVGHFIHDRTDFIIRPPDLDVRRKRGGLPDFVAVHFNREHYRIWKKDAKAAKDVKRIDDCVAYFSNAQAFGERF